MKLSKFEYMIGGWFIGDFEPSVLKTKDFEVGYKIHPKGENWGKHTHKHIVEYNFLVRGKMTMCGKDLKAGDIFVVYPDEISEPVFHEDCEIVTVKTPSIPSDKINL